MTKKNKVLTNGQKFDKSKLRYGDWGLLAEVINAPSPDAAKKRVLRGDQDAIDALNAIFENREEFIQEYQSKNLSHEN